MSTPASAPFTCTACSHDHGKYAGCLATIGFGIHCKCPEPIPPQLPEPHELASALVVTSWTCPFCQTAQDVWGEGAICTWMECESCHKPAWLTDSLPS